MSTTLKIKLSEFGLTLIKGRTYRIEIDEDFVIDSNSPINLGNPASNRVARWTATGFDTENITFSFGAGGSIIITFDEDFTVSEGDYFVSDYIASNYISDTLGTITLYGEDSTLVDSWAFPNEVGITSNKIILSGASLTDNEYYWITIPEDMIFDVYGITNNQIDDFDFEFTGADPVIALESTMSSSASLTCEAYVNVDYPNATQFSPINQSNANFGKSLTLNDDAFVVTYDQSDNTEYVYISNYKSVDNQTLTNYSNNARTQLSDNYLLTGNTLNVPPITTYFDVFQTNSTGQTISDITIDTTVATEFSREENASSGDYFKFMMNKNGYFTYRKDDGADSVFIGTITGHDNPSVSISQIDQPSGDTDSIFCEASNVSEDYVLVAGSNGTVNVFDIDTHTLVRSISVGFTDIRTIAASGDILWVASLNDNEMWDISTGTEYSTPIIGGIDQIAACEKYFIAGGTLSGVIIVRSSSRTTIRTISDVGGGDVAITNNSFAIADPDYTSGGYTNKGLVVVYH